jgi:gamma-glutamylaminecyclotransferase
MKTKKFDKTLIMKLFVYGTLKNGYRNHYFLNSATFIKESISYFKYPMLKRSRFGFFSYPVLFNEPEMGNYIKGEVYEINEKIMKRLDILEGFFTTVIRKGIF